MANAENGIVSPDVLGTQPAPGRTRSGKPAGPAFKPMQRDDVDEQQMASLIALYDDSFKNMAEGEVVKGTVLRLTETAVVVDVGYKSEGLIAISEFLTREERSRSSPATSSMSCWNVPRIATATSCCRARRPRR